MATFGAGAEVRNSPRAVGSWGGFDRCAAFDPIRDAAALRHDGTALAQQVKPAMLGPAIARAGQVEESEQRRVITRSPKVHPVRSDIVAVSDHPIHPQVRPDGGANVPCERLDGRSQPGRRRKEKDKHGGR